MGVTAEPHCLSGSLFSVSLGVLGACGLYDQTNGDRRRCALEDASATVHGSLRHHRRQVESGDPEYDEYIEGRVRKMMKAKKAPNLPTIGCERAVQEPPDVGCCSFPAATARQLRA